MTTLPEPPAATAAGQATPTDADRAQAARLLAALDEIPTRFRDETPLPAYGSTPPVPQPGIPPMSQKATDAGRLMMYGGLATVPPGLMLTAVLVASEHADPTVVGIIFGAPIALVLAIARLATRAKGVLPEEHHHHYNAPVDQRTQQTKTSGLWARTNNQQ